MSEDAHGGWWNAYVPEAGTIGAHGQPIATDLGNGWFQQKQTGANAGGTVQFTDGGKLNRHWDPQGNYLGEYQGAQNFSLRDIAEMGLTVGGAALGMNYLLPGAGLGGGLGGAAGAGAGGFGGSVSTGMGSFLPLGGTAGAGVSAASGAGGGLFGGLLGGGGALGGLGGALNGLGGAMGWGDLIGGGLGLLGSVIGGNKAQSAANTSAASQLEAARMAADAAKFRPVGITTRFGQSGFQLDGNGNLVGAGYSLSPELAAMREGLLGDAQRGLGFARQAQGQGQGLFNLGQQYLSQSPEEAASNWMTKQQSLLAPSRERALSGVRNNLFNTGRTGLAVGATGERPDGSAGLGAANPELEAYYNSIAQQDAQLGSQADQFARDQISFGQGLLGGGIDLMSLGYNPFKTALGLSDTVEGFGRDALTLGSELGGKTATAGANAGRSLLSGGISAAETLRGPNSYSPFGTFLQGAAGNQQLMSGLGSWTSGLFGGNRPAVNLGTATGSDLAAFY